MTDPMSNAGRLLDDDDLPPPDAVSHRGWSKMGESRMMPPREVPRLAGPEASSYAPPLRPAQRACYEALSLALQEGHVFAAVTGPAAAGKTMVLDSVLSDKQNRSLRCIRISNPDKVPARLAAQIEEIAYAEAGKPENLERHVVLAIDDAHTASDDLLRCLVRLAAMREPGRRVPQVLLVGRSELWHRLASEELSPLARRIAIRASLPPLEEEVDPWASLEAEVSQTMSAIRAESALAFDRGYPPNFLAETEAAGLPLSDEPVPQPLEYALFPDSRPARSRSEQREGWLRLILPISCLAVGVAVFATVLSYSYDWPDLFGEMPWSQNKPESAKPFVFSSQGSSHGLPRPPGWNQTPQKHSVAGSPNPYAPPPLADKPAAVASAAPPAEPVLAEASPATGAPAAATAGPGFAAPVAIVAPPTAVAEPPRRDPVADAPTLHSVRSSPSPAAVMPALAALPPSPPSAEAQPVSPPRTETRVAAPVPAPRQVASLPTPPAPPPATRPAPLSAPVVALLLRRGDEQSGIGDVFAARLLFERAAEAGSAQGALRLARTYDPAFLSPAYSHSLGDTAAARRWYTRAIALGDKDAATRLKAINEGR